MELRHLRYFVAVAESLHFGQAAAKLRIAQPSLSHQIRRLEDEVRTTLLERTNRRVALTDAGRLFLQEAIDIIARADHATVMARRMGRANTGRLRIGIGYCTDQTDIAALLGAFHDQHQDIQVETKTMSVPSQLAALLDGQLDVGFVRPPVRDSALNSEVVIREPLVVALPPKHRLASRARLQLSALANEPFILPPRDAVPVFHDAVLKACREAGFVPNAPHAADHLHMVIGLVATGAGVALVPAAASKIDQGRVVYRALRPSPDNLETLMAWRQGDTSATLAEFISAARRALSHATRVLR
jgi:DNA-binding transcriptional LysR family regulator